MVRSPALKITQVVEPRLKFHFTQPCEDIVDDYCDLINMISVLRSISILYNRIRPNASLKNVAFEESAANSVPFILLSTYEVVLSVKKIGDPCTMQNLECVIRL